MKELGKDKALIINTIASFVTFIVGLGIAFFFTPFLTDTVGEEAYGFVSLGNNVINYITILTVALNSVAGRFITIEYHQGKKKEANELFFICINGKYSDHTGYSCSCSAGDLKCGETVRYSG